MSTQREAAAALATGERVWVDASTQPGTQGWGVVTGRIEGYDLWKVGSRIKRECRSTR